MNTQEHEFLPIWARVDGEASDVVISSRIRLARNLKTFPFPNLAGPEQLNKVSETVIKVAAKKAAFGPLAIIRIEELSPKERLILVEKHLCSPQFAEDPQGRLLFVNQEQSVSVMVNEEDHLRIQTITPGFTLDDALKLADQVDDYFEEGLDLSYDEYWGYLTACPTNVGTGLRASVMLHLPGLAMVDQVKRVLSALVHLGISIRGLYGEGTEALGDIYQISNSVTLGNKEEDLVNNIKSVCRQVIEQERVVRTTLLRDSKLQLEDRIYRSFGLLTQARMLSSQEALKLLSDVKLGAEVGILTGVNKSNIKELFFLSRASILQKVAGRDLNPAERDSYRASIIRSKLTI